MAPPNSLNICMIAPGDLKFLLNFVRALARSGHRVTVIWRRSKNRAAPPARHIPGVQLIDLVDTPGGSRAQYGHAVLQKFVQLHRADPFDLVHCLDGAGAQIARRRKQFGVTTIFDVDATHLAQVYSILGMSQENSLNYVKVNWRLITKFISTFWRFDRKLLKSADAIFVHSPQQRQILERYYAYPDSRIFMVPFGLEVEDLEPRSRDQGLATKLGLPVDAEIVVTVTDMSEIGEIRNLLYAFERVAIKKPNARLVIVGQGAYLKEIEYETLQLALGSRVIFAGEIDPLSLGDHIALADVFVNLSARSSGIERSLLEAMAQRKIVIGSEVSPLANVVHDGTDGFLVRPADTFTLSELLLRTFNGLIDRVAVGESARQKVLNLFDSQTLAARTVNAYFAVRTRFVTAHRPWFSFSRRPAAP